MGRRGDLARAPESPIFDKASGTVRDEGMGKSGEGCARRTALRRTTAAGVLGSLLVAGGTGLAPESTRAEEIYRYRSPDGVLHFSNAPTDRRFSTIPRGDTFSGETHDTGRSEDLPPPSAVPAPAHRAVKEPPPALARMIDEVAFRYRIEKALFHAMIRAESGFDPGAVSEDGASGLLQLMPATASALGVEDVFHPRQNLEGGALYLRRLLHRYDNDIVLALAAYNAGPGAVDAHGGVPPFEETRIYLARIGRYRREHLVAREKEPHLLRRNGVRETPDAGE